MSFKSSRSAALMNILAHFYVGSNFIMLAIDLKSSISPSYFIMVLPARIKFAWNFAWQSMIRIYCFFLNALLSQTFIWGVSAYEIWPAFFGVYGSVSSSTVCGILYRIFPIFWGSDSSSAGGVFCVDMHRYHEQLFHATFYQVLDDFDCIVQF